MRTTTFTEFRQNARDYFDAVERGETVTILRRGKTIAKLIPVSANAPPSWKRPALRLALKGATPSREILRERRQAKR